LNFAARRTSDDDSDFLYRVGEEIRSQDPIGVKDSNNIALIAGITDQDSPYLAELLLEVSM